MVHSHLAEIWQVCIRPISESGVVVHTYLSEIWQVCTHTLPMQDAVMQQYFGLVNALLAQDRCVCVSL